MGRRKSFGERLLTAALKGLFSPPKVQKSKTVAKPKASVQTYRPSSPPKPPKPITPEQRQKIRAKERQQQRLRDMASTEIDLHFQNEERMFLSIKSITSYSEAGLNYSINMLERTCTCKDFAERRGFPKDHTARLCKHLWRELVYEARVRFCSGDAEAIHSIQKGPLAAYKLTLDDDSQPILVIHKAQDGDVQWIDLYVGYDRYGWSISDRRWSYGDSPPQAREIRGILSHIVAIRHYSNNTNIDLHLKPIKP